jgi:hypothetical protein
VNAGEFRYVWRAIDDVLEVDRGSDGEGFWIDCPHRRWHPNTERTYCRECVEPGLRQLVEEGARDDEILPAFAAMPIPDRRWMEATLSRLRSEGPGPAATMDKRRARTIPDLPTAYDAAILALKHNQTRLTWPNVATEMARAHGITLHPSTLRDWCGSGWTATPRGAGTPAPHLTRT